MDFNTSAHFNPEVWSKRKLHQQAQKAIIDQLRAENLGEEDDMKIQEVSTKTKAFVASFSPPRATSKERSIPEDASSKARVITGGGVQNLRRKFLKKGSSVQQKKTRYQLAQEKKREREMNKNKESPSKPNRFRENIRKWQAIDRQRWETVQNSPPKKRKASQTRGRKSDHAFDDVPIPTAAEFSPTKNQAHIHDNETDEAQLDGEPEVVYENVMDYAADKEQEEVCIPESEVQAVRTRAPRPPKKKYPACSHHVSSIFPYDRSHKKKRIQSQQTKLVQQRLKSTEDTRRLRKEHEEEVHKLKRKIERIQKEMLKVKMEKKTLDSQVSAMKEKLQGFESAEGKSISQEKKQFITWKKAEMKKIKKLQRELDAKAKLILNIPNKQLRRDIQDLKGAHQKKIQEMKERHDRTKAHNESLRKKVQHLETEIRTLTLTNKRLTQANAEVLSNHAAKVLRPALAVIAKQNDKKQKEACFLKRTVSSPVPPVKAKINRKEAKPFVPKTKPNSPKIENSRRPPKIEQIYHPEHLTVAQQQSCHLHENEVPHESVERSHYTAHKYSDGSCVRVFSSGAVIRKFPDGTSLTVHENGDKEKIIHDNASNSQIKCYWFTEHQILKIFFSDGKQWIHFDNGEFQEIRSDGSKIIFRDGKVVEQS